MVDLILSAVGLGALILAPGFFAASILRRSPGDGVSALIEAWSAGFAIVGLLALAVHIAGSGLTALGWAWSLTTALTAVVAWRSNRLHWSHPGRTRLLTAGLIAGLAVVCVLSQANPLSAYRDDGAHLAEIQAVASEGVVFPSANFHAPGEVPGPDPRFGAVHTAYGFVARLLGAPPEVVWEAARLLAAPILWLTFLELCLIVLGRTDASVFSTLLAMLFLGGMRFSVNDVAMYPLWVGMAGVWLLSARWIEYVAGRESTRLDLLLLGALPLIHYFPWLLACLMGLGLLLVSAIRARSLSMRGVPTFRVALLIAASVAILSARLLISYGRDNPIHQESWNILTLWGPVIAFQPLAVYESIGFLGLVAPVVWWRVRRSHSASDPVGWSWTGATTALPFIAPLNPVAVTLLHPFLGFLLYRVSLGSLYPVVWGDLIARTLALRPRLRPVLLPAVGIGLVAANLYAGPGERGANQPSFDSATRSAICSVATTLPADAIVLSDPYTMLGFAAFTDAPVVAVPDGRSSPRDPEAQDRLSLASMSFDVTAPDWIRRLPVEHFGATHVVVHDWGQRLRGYMVDIDSTDFPKLGEIWAESSEREVSGSWSSRWRVFALRPSTSSDAPEVPVPPVALPAEIESVAVFPSSLAPGGDVTVTVTWRVTATPEATGTPRIYLRMDHAQLTGSDAVGGKLIRKVRERWTGSVERLRSSFTPPLATVVQAARDGSSFATEHTLKLPKTLRPGTYEIQLLWQVDQRSHLEHMSGLLNNRDSYSGQAVAIVEVLR